MFVICVEGNIGSGKSEFLKAMQDVMNCKVVQEPVPIKYLEKMYADFESWYYPFQLIMATERKLAQNKAIELEKQGNNIVILERSLYTDGLFAELGIKDLKELEKYRIFKQEVLRDIIVQPELYIYLRSTPEECLKRIKERMCKDKDRECESVVSLEYLQALHDKHEEWLMNKNLNTPLIILSPEDQDWRIPEIAKLASKLILEKIKTIRER